MLERGRWLNEPHSWTARGGVLEVTTDAARDFWRETHYGFVRHSGHFLAVEAEGDFTAQVKVEARFTELYDQAGLMVRLDEARWLKAGVEFNDGRPWLSSVLTLDRSDWATAPLPADVEAFWLRVTVSAGALRLQSSLDGLHWPLVRLAPFPASPRYEVGPMCCTPQREGLTVRFSDFSLTPPNGKDLHDLS